jgi:hypothetical protein
MMLARLGLPLGGSLHRLLRLPSFFRGVLVRRVFGRLNGLESRREGEESRGVTPTQSGAYPVARAHGRAMKYVFFSLSLLSNRLVPSRSNLKILEKTSWQRRFPDYNIRMNVG